MIPSLESRGFGHGSGLVNPNGTRFLVNIPKNASSYMVSWANKFGWTASLAQNHQDSIQEMIVILRDPVDRWVSGISQYICTYIQSVEGPNGPVFDVNDLTEHDYFLTAEMFVAQYTDLTERLLIDAASQFDDHVWLQSELIRGLLPESQKTYFRLGPDLNKNISNYLEFDMFNGLDYNRGADNPDQKIIQDFFLNRLKIRPELKQRLENHYRLDYDLINSVKFYGE